jgi:hypothetical protein
MILPKAPDSYNRSDQDRLRNALEVAVMRLEQLPTGWAQATGTASRATFDTATVTLLQLAQVVKALIDDLVFKVKT